jgi:hypothetical protein
MTFAPTGSCIGARLVRNGTGNGGALSGDERQRGLDDQLLQKEKGGISVGHLSEIRGLAVTGSLRPSTPVPLMW